jgi:hypothetical protein
VARFSVYLSARVHRQAAKSDERCGCTLVKKKRAAPSPITETELRELLADLAAIQGGMRTSTVSYSRELLAQVIERLAAALRASS